jgi:uncharacterized protein involved in response to NO
VTIALRLAGAPADVAPRGAPILRKGFRPFFFLAALHAALVIPVWIGVLEGHLRLRTSFDPTLWHAHEVVFGFVVAVIAGFLLTAVGNWTGRETAVGAPLAALVALWVGGRVAIACAPVLPAVLVALVDVAFLPALAVTVGRPLRAAGNRRNYVMIAILLALAAANLATHLHALGVLPTIGHRAVRLSVDVVVLLCALIAGRVLPMFTRNATLAAAIVSDPRADAVAAIAIALTALANAFGAPNVVVGAVAALASVALVVRARRWGCLHAFRVPLLAILHAGHAWMVIGFALHSASAWGASVPPASALHALTVGAIGSFVLGMMARVSLGHTGRMLVPPRSVAFAFALLQVAAIVRIVVPWASPAHALAGLATSGALWSMSFLVFAVAYAPVLLRARVDGKAG